MAVTVNFDDGVTDIDINVYRFGPAENTASAVAVAQLNGGTQYRYKKGTTKKFWDLSFSSLTDTEIANLKSFYDGVEGAFDSFTYTDPDLNTFTVTWQNESFSPSQDFEGSHSLEVRLQEV